MANADMCLEAARKAFPDNEELRVAYMLGFNEGYDRATKEPSLPSDLDEAAEEYRRESFKKSVMPQIDGPISEYGGSIKDAFKAGAKWKYQKDRAAFAKLKAKEWMSGYDDAVSRFVKIPYKPRDWFSSKDGDFICGASFDEAIPAKVELYYRTKLEEK